LEKLSKYVYLLLDILFILSPALNLDFKFCVGFLEKFIPSTQFFYFIIVFNALMSAYLKSKKINYFSIFYILLKPFINFKHLILNGWSKVYKTDIRLPWAFIEIIITITGSLDQIYYQIKLFFFIFTLLMYGYDGL